MSDETPVLHVDARLRAAGLRLTVSPTPTDEVLALIDEARHAGMCGTRTVVATPDGRWRHPICAVLVPHLGYHRALSGDLWSQDAAELEATARQLLAEQDRARAERDAANAENARLVACVRDAESERDDARDERDHLRTVVAELRQAIRQALDEILPYDLGTETLAAALARTDPTGTGR